MTTSTNAHALVLPEPKLDADDAPLSEGEAVALPLPLGPAVTLRFPSHFEPYLSLDGKRVIDDGGPDARELLLWSSRRLAALWRALGERTGLRPVFVGGGADAQIVVTDIVAFSEQRYEDEPAPEPEWYDHGLLRERLDAANVQLARFSLLGPLSTKAELEKRVRATYAPGTLVEVRVEDGRRVIARRRVRVGR